LMSQADDPREKTRWGRVLTCESPEVWYAQVHTLVALHLLRERREAGSRMPTPIAALCILLPEGENAQ
jgi:hypothetical protein